MVLSGLGCASRPEPLRTGDIQEGYASWYGREFNGRKTASGEVYDMNAMTGAHRTAAFGSSVRVTNLANGKSAIVRINDRGPFVKGRIIDLSFAAATELGLIGPGTGRVKLDVVEDPPSALYWLQVGSFSQKANADEFLAALRQRFSGPAPVVEVGEGYHRVRFGPLKSEEEAVALMGRLRGSGFPGIILRR